MLYMEYKAHLEHGDPGLLICRMDRKRLRVEVCSQSVLKVAVQVESVHWGVQSYKYA